MKISIELQQPFPNFFLFPSGILAPNPGKVRRQFPAGRLAAHILPDDGPISSFIRFLPRLFFDIVNLSAS